MKFGVLAASVLLAGTSAIALSTSASATPVIEKSAYVTPAAASAAVDFEVFLPLRNTAALDTLLAAQQNKASSSYHKWLTPTQFKAQFGPTADSVSRVAAALQAQGFSVTNVHSRSLEVTGAASAVAKTFSTSLSHVQPVKGAARMVANTPLVMPAALKAEGAMVVSFSGRPLKQPFHKKLGLVKPDNRYGSTGPYWFTDLKEAYFYPSAQTTVNQTAIDGTGVNVAIVISNAAQQSDLTAFFDHEKYSTVSGKPDPTFTDVPINGGAPYDLNASLESSLDIQQVLGGAPGSNVSLIDLPDLSDENIISGYLYVVESNQYDLVNSSFGGCELVYTAAYNGGTDFTGILDVYDTLFKQGNAQGITFVASSGDSGGKLCPSADYVAGGTNGTFVPGVSFPADSPNVTAVGGGNLQTTDASMATGAQMLKSAYVSEDGLGDPEMPYDVYGTGYTVSGGTWGAGGGVSAHFLAPAYQSLVRSGSSMYRTLPDVGMQVGGCPGLATSCNPGDSAAIVADGVNSSDGGFFGVIGTSVSSPEFVGAVALYEQSLVAQGQTGRQGNLNTFLYTAAAAQTAKTGAAVFRHPAQGNDGLYTEKQPSQAYNYIYGNGSPIVRSLFGMGTAAAAGLPQTKSNP
ncbi:protease pro-enzyme activation domain-containing protein [Caulobacter sp. S45]|uniref:S53 family peptidase n=1 Tax=Caulobacter sp. S45 TaxID=1641861 RepID=UPI001574F55D|nr:protease pro-enzyme activation domain-containing protein [Caulobacter sp. S45]